MAVSVFNISKLLRTTILRRFSARSQFFQFSSNTMADTEKPLESSIRKKLESNFKPSVLDVINESYMHNVPKGSETHFKVLVVSDTFEGMPLVQRHRSVNTALEEEFASGLHALSIVAEHCQNHIYFQDERFHAKTPSQWEKSNQQVGPSPPCRGGAGL